MKTITRLKAARESLEGYIADGKREWLELAVTQLGFAIHYLEQPLPPCLERPRTDDDPMVF